VPLLVRAGTSLYFDGQYAEAVAAFTEGLRLEPGNAPMVDGLAQAQTAVATVGARAGAGAGAAAGAGGGGGGGSGSSAGAGADGAEGQCRAAFCGVLCAAPALHLG
jgi:hypothetical protein